MLSNCVITGNSAFSLGGGTFLGTLDNCTLIGNAIVPLLLNRLANGGGGGAEGSTLTGCILASNSAGAGGGAFLATLYNCVLVGNSTFPPQGYAGAGDAGGGAGRSKLYDCLLMQNSAGLGGGAYSCDLYNCTVVSNSAFAVGGGVEASIIRSSSLLYNCVIYYNSAPSNSNYDVPGSSSPGSILNCCCTTPIPPGGTGNITNVPLLLNFNAGDFHLQSNSPCINAGNNAYVSSTNDLDGNLRISGGTVDIGAYEFQNPASIISYAWLDQYGLPADGSADFLDTDHDGLNNWQEWIVGTDPTNPLSVLQSARRLRQAAQTLSSTWQSASNVTYSLQAAPPILPPNPRSNPWPPTSSVRSAPLLTPIPTLLLPAPITTASVSSSRSTANILLLVGNEGDGSLTYCSLTERI